MEGEVCETCGKEFEEPEERGELASGGLICVGCMAAEARVKWERRPNGFESPEKLERKQGREAEYINCTSCGARIQSVVSGLCAECGGYSV